MRKFILVVVVCVMLLGLTAQTAGAGSGCRTWHTVRYGQTLSGIAWHYGTTVQRIAKANHIRNPNRIWAGQSLCIPDGTKKHDDDDNGRDDDKDKKGKKCDFTYKVKRGEWVYKIARHYDVQANCVIRYNGLHHPNRIVPGQHIYIPCACRW